MVVKHCWQMVQGNIVHAPSCSQVSLPVASSQKHLNLVASVKSMLQKLPVLQLPLFLHNKHNQVQ